MPKPNNPKLAIRLDLLRPQSNPEKVLTKSIRWLLSSGRFILIFVEAIVLIAFITRFKLDADLEANKEKIVVEQSPYIESQKSFEVLTREIQLKLSTIGSFKSDYVDFPQILKRIADKTPDGVRLITINFEKVVGKIDLQLSAYAASSNDMTLFVSGLKQDPLFSNLNVASVTFDKGSLNFTLEGQVSQEVGGKSL